MKFDKRMAVIRERVQKADVDGLVLAATVSFSGFPVFAQEAPKETAVKYWGFSHGINATFQYPVLGADSARAIVRTPVDEEIGGENGEGVDAFTLHGTKKCQLVLTIYSSLISAPFWFKTLGKPPVPEYNGGLFAIMNSQISMPWADEMVKVMEWGFFQTNRVAFNGDVNKLAGPGGAVINLSFEPEEIH